MSLQYWFERFAGVTDEERRRAAFAKDFFGQRGLDTMALQRPACWRRSRTTTRCHQATSRG